MSEANKMGESTAVDRHCFTGFRCPVRKGPFGEWCDTGLTGLMFVLYRAGHGWKSGPGRLEFSKHPGQIYVDDLQRLIDEFGPREIVAIDLQVGQWRTIWASKDSEVSCP